MWVACQSFNEPAPKILVAFLCKGKRKRNENNRAKTQRKNHFQKGLLIYSSNMLACTCAIY